VFTPIIRNEIRNIKLTSEGHYTVYLPSYDDNTLIQELSVFKNIHWHVFSKHCTEAFDFENIRVQKINNKEFVDSMAKSTGVLCGAGFETPAEALFMNKKLLVIPMKGQYEQQCNAAFLASLGVPVVSSLSKVNRPEINAWLHSDNKVLVDYPDNTNEVVCKVLQAFAINSAHKIALG
jgi:uncharacterized protein (TIGR00661 family)